MVDISPEIAALIPAFVVLTLGVLLPILGAFRMRGGALAGITVLGLLIAGTLSLASLYSIPGLGFMPAAQVGAPIISFALLEWTPFVIVFDLVFLSVALVIALASPRYITGRHQGEYYSLIVLSTLGMMMVAASRDLMTLFVGLELSSFATYALAGFFKSRLSSSEAAMKYFLIGSISSSLALFGISMVYGLTGATSFEALASLWQQPVRAADGGALTTIGAMLLSGRFTLGVFVWTLLLAGFGFKIAMVPFHNYAVDVYDGAPSTIGGFLAAGSKQMGFAALFKVFLLGMFAVKANWDVAIGVLAVITMVVGNVAALSQTNLKRMLAYSSIAQAGYILIALAVGTPFALAGGIFHIITYAFMQAGAFIALSAAATWGVGETFDDWRGMSKRAPGVALAMALFMFSFAGIPPLAGFASKFVLFSSAIAAGGWYIWLAVAGILTSAISLAYYWRLVRVMYMDEAPAQRRLGITAAAGLALIITAVATVALGLFPAFPFELSAQAATDIFAAIIG